MSSARVHPTAIIEPAVRLAADVAVGPYAVLEGTIELVNHKLTIGPNGKVNAAVKSREVVVLGSIQGNVEASDKLEIRKDARLVGDIKTARIIIEDGAYFKGSIDIVKPEPKPAAQPARPATPAPAVSPSNATPATAAEVKR